MSKIPEGHRDILEKKAYAHIATVDASGIPQVTPVWFTTEGEDIIVNSPRGRKKDRNIEARPGQIALSIQDPDDPYRYIGVQGRVVEITEVGANDVINQLSRKYGGRDYTFNPKETRVTYRIAVDRAWVMG